MLTEEYNYVVVIVSQVTPAPNPKRAVTNIVGPGTNINYLTKTPATTTTEKYIYLKLKPINPPPPPPLPKPRGLKEFYVCSISIIPISSTRIAICARVAASTRMHCPAPREPL